MKLWDYISKYTTSYAYMHFMREFQLQLSVMEVIEAIPKMEMTYVRRPKKIRTFPLFSESAVTHRALHRIDCVARHASTDDDGDALRGPRRAERLS